MTEEKFEACIKAVSDGDKSALKELYEEYMPYLYTVIYGVLGNREEAEDVTSECFIKIWQTADRYKPGNGHKGYLAAIARNMAIDSIRKRSKEELTDEMPEDSGEYGKSGPEEESVSGITIKAAMEKLPPSEREIINMKVLSDMTFKEISETLKVPMGTVTWRYGEGIKKLKRSGFVFGDRDE